MTSERIQRQVARLLDEAEEAITREDWATVAARARAVLRLDSSNADARAYLAASGQPEDAPSFETVARAAGSAQLSQPTSFANGRYEVRRFLGEGGRKRVYLAHDTELDRDVAFALIKTEGLDEAARVRVAREAQSMGRLGSHPHIVTVYDIGEEAGAPYLVLPVLPGGDVEGVIEKAEGHKLPVEQAVKIAVETCLGLEFSHSKGIIHRDLKPGNVWLAEDGRAMIGDFGLAVAVDRSRLTQAGMMVGTVSYMPPEQALGGEVTPRSDLYSLGAMLYEMVCGRPPFVGDESVAIIGQHLNTPPVAPTWHRPDCPPALEALILRLLEKDPGKRPESASELRQALETIWQSREQAPVGGGLAPAQDGVTATPNPLYRRTFVGRENEVKQLQQAFDGAMSGNGALVMVVGEPGIGKTALCEQLATYVALRGGKALVGHCYEEGSLSLPYLAFVEAMRSYVLARDPEGLRSDLGTGAADVARIVSEVRDRVQGVELRAAGDPEDDRWRLLQAITSFLRNASTVQPLAIVLEDLHWADRGTLDLLLHVARNLQGARLLIVGTYRDVEVDRAHPLSGTLAELRRQERFLRVPLRGLTVDEVHRMYAAIRGQEVSWAQAEAVHRQTEGNPLFIQEVIRYMVEEGYVVREGGRWVLAEGTQPGSGLPEGLRDVVGKRLSRLSDSCNRLLSVAAVIGRDFDLETLRAIAGLSEDDLIAAIEEAVRVGVLEERSLPGALRYRFAHAFFRTALYEEMIAARRLRLHQEVARALEAQYAARREEHAAELAEHYGQSTDRADLAKAVEYSELAAKRAMSVFAYAEAEQHLRRCLEVQEVLDPEDKARRCDLLLALGEALLPQDHPARVAEDVGQIAYTMAEGIEDSQRAARVAILCLQGLTRGTGTTTAMRSPIYHDWASKADTKASPGTVERVYADIHMGLAFIESRGPAAGHAYLRSAVECAVALGDDSAFYAAAGQVMQRLRALRDNELITRLAEEMKTRPRAGAKTADVAQCLFSGGWILISGGDRVGATKLWEEHKQLAAHTRDAALAMDARQSEMALAFFDGRLEEAEQRLKNIQEESQERSIAASVQAWLFVRLALYLGHPLDALSSIMENFMVGRPGQAARCAVLSHLGRWDEAMAIQSRFQGLGSHEDETAHQILSYLLEGAIAREDTDTIRLISPRLESVSGKLSSAHCVSYGRLLGEGAVRLNAPAESLRYFTQALDVCEKVRFRPEIALIRLDLAELLLDHYPDEREAAIEHLDFAIAELRDMKMQPALERALRRRGLLKA